MPPGTPRSGFALRLLRLSWFKVGILAGGKAGLTAILITAVLCGITARSVQTAGSGHLNLMVCDQDGSALSEELAEQLESLETVSVVRGTQSAGEAALLTGDAEGLLILGSGYGAALNNSSEELPLHYEGASGARSVQGAREIVAGAVLKQRSLLRAPDQAAELLGRDLSDTETADLQNRIRDTEASMPALFHIAEHQGAVAEDPFRPAPMSFGALTCLLTCLTAAFWCGGRDSRRVERRMSVLPNGVLLSYGSDCLALTLLGLLSLLAVLVPVGALSLGSICACALCTAALARALVRISALEGRVDVLAPFLALALCLLGGCFQNLSGVSEQFHTLSYLSPPGLAVHASEGSIPAGLTLLGMAAALFLLGFPRRSARRS